MRRPRTLPFALHSVLFLSITLAAGTLSAEVASLNHSRTDTGDRGSFLFAPRSISDDGRWIVFGSNAMDLTTDPDTIGTGDVFAHDTQTRETIAISRNQSVSAMANGSSSAATISGNGQWVSFHSVATDLTDDPDGNGTTDIYIHHIPTRSTRMVSLRAAGDQGGNGLSAWSRISGDGAWVAFISNASDLDPLDTDQDADLFVRHIESGVTHLVSRDAAGTTSVGNDSGLGAITPFAFDETGARLVYATTLAGLSDLDTNLLSDVFVFDTATLTNQLVSVNGTGTAAGNAKSLMPTLAAAGGHVAFLSEAEDLVPNDGNRAPDIFVRDLNAGTTTLVTVNSNGFSMLGGVKGEVFPLIDRLGQRVIFRTRSSDVAPPGTIHHQLFVRDLPSGTTHFVSADRDGQPASGFTTPSAFTHDGRYLMFSTLGDDMFFLPPDDGIEIVVKDLIDLQNQRSVRISKNAMGNAGASINALSNRSMSGNGYVAAYTTNSAAPALVDTNGRNDVFFVRVAIFEDGFESGDSRFWSASTPVALAAPKPE